MGNPFVEVPSVTEGIGEFFGKETGSALARIDVRDPVAVVCKIEEVDCEDVSGLESPHVMLFPAYTHKQLECFENGSEAEECRLFYVGMTRASERVEVVHQYFGGKEYPPLAAL